MPYPYTLGAKLKAFPFKFHFDNLWVVRSWVGGFFLCLPIMYKIQIASGYGLFGEGERNLEQIRAKEAARHAH